MNSQKLDTMRSSRKLDVVFYTHIDLNHDEDGGENITEAQVIRRAHTLGYELMRFPGWTDAELASPRFSPQSRLTEVRANQAKIHEITNAFPDYTVSIFQVNSRQCDMPEVDDLTYHETPESDI